MVRFNRHKRASRYFQNPLPKYTIGDIAGDFEIISYIGYSAVHPDKVVRLSQEHHWYKCKCHCGEIETHTQQQLNDTRRLRQCGKCSATIITNAIPN